MRLLLLIVMFTLAACVSGCSSFDAVAKNPNCVVRVSGKTTFGGGMPVGEARYSAVCNQKDKEAPPAPPAPDEVKPPSS